MIPFPPDRKDDPAFAKRRNICFASLFPALYCFGKTSAVEVVAGASDDHSSCKGRLS
ncbi:hypothetical protein EBBID32_10480 [Sphingobium indicum BiD32]|uniref:Uncharacterized protein n=1 Tax=Sphingobium indicum BiD32 TaxID=1301087 RepID=N1MHN7_9SPHN|nr:hypothetical protein EBBID32_10480 [Sphingobium indicum BiD32]